MSAVDLRWSLPPEPLNETVGRTELTSELVDRIVDGACRLVTLCGPPGIGKSRVALEVARRLPFAVWYADLKDTDAVDDLQRLFSSSPPQATGPRCLILDNADLIELEQPLEHQLRTDADVTIVLARRSPTGASGEAEIAIPPLQLVDEEADGAVTIETASERLFTSRATAIGTLGEGDRRHVRALCQALDGVPLALELAAARTRSLSPREIRTALAESVRILEPSHSRAGSTGLVSRIESSYGRLSDKDQQLLRHAAVLDGPVTLAVLHAIADPSESRSKGWATVEFLNAVERTIRAGMLYRPVGSDRVRLLNPTRLFLREELVAAGEAETVYRKHADCYLQRAERAYAFTSSGDQLAALDELADPNIESALGRLMASPADEAAEDALGLAGAVAPLWQLRGTWSHGLQVLQQVLLRAPARPTDRRARAEFGAAGLALSLNRFEDAVSLLSQAIHHYETTDASMELAHSLNVLGAVHSRNGSHSLGMETINRALAIMRRLGDPRGTALAINNLGLVATARGQHGRAARYFEDALRLLQRTTDQRAAAWAMINLGDATWDRGDLKRAATLYHASLEIGVALGGRSIVAACIDGLAAIAAGAGRLDDSASLLGAADGIRDSLGGTAPRYRASSRERVQRVIRGGLGDARYRTLRVAGKEMSYEQAVSLSLATRDAASLAPASAALADPIRFSPAVLTRRELEVVGHLAHGLTNRKVARALGISPGTAARHVENILGKLGLRNRAQVTAWAHESGVAREQNVPLAAPPYGERAGTA